MKHNMEVKIYHADTDCYGIVWHGSYLRFFEQARCEFVSLASTSMKYFEDKGIFAPSYMTKIQALHYYAMV